MNDDDRQPLPDGGKSRRPPGSEGPGATGPGATARNEYGMREFAGRIPEDSGVARILVQRMAILFLDDGFRIASFTPPAKSLLRLDDRDLGRPLVELTDRLRVPDLRSVVQSVAETGRTSEREVTVENGGRPQTFILHILPYLGRDQSIRGVVLTLIDLSEFKRSEQRLAAMVSELNHRVKNSLAAVQAMIRQTRTHASSFETFCDKVEGRIHAMTSAHDLLSRAAWERASLREIAAAVLAPFAGSGSDRLRLTGPDIELRSEFVVSIGLILHELATNAIKYGAWSNEAGAVQLAWVYLQDDRDMLRIDWTERDGPTTTEPEQENFGLRFIRQSTEYDLHGHCSTEFAPDGLICRLELPADTLRWLPSPDNLPEPSRQEITRGADN